MVAKEVSWREAGYSCTNWEHAEILETLNVAFEVYWRQAGYNYTNWELEKRSQKFRQILSRIEMARRESWHINLSFLEILSTNDIVFVSDSSSCN